MNKASKTTNENLASYCDKLIGPPYGSEGRAVENPHQTVQSNQETKTNVVSENREMSCCHVQEGFSQVSCFFVFFALFMSLFRVDILLYWDKNISSCFR